MQEKDVSVSEKAVSLTSITTLDDHESHAEPKPTNDDGFSYDGEAASGKTRQRLSIRLICTLGLLWFTAFFPILDETMMATLLTPVSSEFNSFRNISWISSIYLIAFVASQAIAGHLAKSFGKLRVLLFSGFLFAAGCLLSGLAKDIHQLLAGRALMGFAGGALMLVINILENDLVSLANRGLTEAAGGVMVATALSCGGIWGGGINDLLGWRYAFFIQIPLITVSLVAVMAFISLPQTDWNLSPVKQIDIIGAATLLGSVVLLQVGLDYAGGYLPWTHPLVLAVLASAAFLLAVFVGWNLFYKGTPVVSLRLLMNRNIAVASVAGFLQAFAYMSTIYYVSLYLQARGCSTSWTGLQFIGQAFAGAVGSTLAGMVANRNGPLRVVNVFSQLFLVTGSALLIIPNAASPKWLPAIFMTISGLGFGSSWITLLLGCLGNAPKDSQDDAQTLFWTTRSLGMIVGLSVSATIFQNTLRRQLAGLPGLTRSLVDTITSDLGVIQTLQPLERDIVIQGVASTTRVIFCVLVGVMAASAISTLLMKRVSLVEDKDSEAKEPQ